VLLVPQRTFKVWVRSFKLNSIRSAGKVPTRSEIVLAGTVIAPSSSIFALIQQEIPNSRLVAERRIRPSSVAINTFASTARVLRGETARETVLKPCANSCCETDAFMCYPLTDFCEFFFL